MIGQTISHYKIIEKLGEGGMGVVYKATDTKLERTVALKFLALHAVEDEEHKARFQREARAAAALDHPNICTVYEIDEIDGQTFLAMAYLEGSTVRQRVKQRPLKLAEALDIAIQAGEGLRAAHAKGIVHRDIKSSNLMVTQDGRVQIMDFGLAQLLGRTKLTETGTSLGTPAYMSPEQARGEAVDRRTDIWSLGVVLYEMVSGQLPFKGERDAAVAYSILNEDPEPLTALRTGVPIEWDRLVSKAVAKNVEERYQHIDEMLVDLRALKKSLPSGSRPVSPGSAVDRRRRRVLGLALAASLAALAVCAALLLLRPASRESTVSQSVRRFSMDLGNMRPVISPDGRHIAYRSGGKLWVRDMASEQPREIPRAEGEGGFYSDFGYYLTWSPDSESLAFRMDNELRRVSVRQGGAAVTICRLPEGRERGRQVVSGMVWSPDGETIVFGRYGAGLFEVPARGGTPKLLFEKDHPHDVRILDRPNGERVLVYAVSAHGHEIKILTAGGEEKTVAGIRSSWPELIWSPTGHILFRRDPREAPSIWALPFSLETLQAGEPFQVVRAGMGASLADDGTLAYLEARIIRQQHLVWRDRSGEVLDQVGQPHQLIDLVMLSPGGDRALVSGRDGARGQVWVHELSRELEARLALGELEPVGASWSHSGEEIYVFAPSSNTSTDLDVYARRADGVGELEPLIVKPGFQVLMDTTSDGRYWLVGEIPPGGDQMDIFYVEQQPDGRPGEWVPFVATPAEDSYAAFSPNERYVAYCSVEFGRQEIYVRPFPKGTGRTQITREGGQAPVWSMDGKELFFGAQNTLFAVPVSTEGEFSLGEPKALFEHPNLAGNAGYPRYGVTPDARRFLTVESEYDIQRPITRVVQNWFSEFRDRERD